MASISHVRSNAPPQRNAVALDEHLHDVADESAADPEAEMRVHPLNRMIATLEPLNRAMLLLYLEEHS